MFQPLSCCLPWPSTERLSQTSSLLCGWWLKTVPVVWGIISKVLSWKRKCLGQLEGELLVLGPQGALLCAVWEHRLLILLPLPLGCVYLKLPPPPWGCMPKTSGKALGATREQAQHLVAGTAVVMSPGLRAQESGSLARTVGGVGKELLLCLWQSYNYCLLWWFLSLLPFLLVNLFPLVSSTQRPLEKNRLDSQAAGLTPQRTLGALRGLFSSSGSGESGGDRCF